MERLVYSLLMHIPGKLRHHRADMGGREGATVQSILGDFSCHILLHPRLEGYLAVIRLATSTGMDS